MKNKLFKEDVSINALLYVLKQLGGVCDMHKASKIFYYADQRHLSLYGRTITGDVYIAMQYGPVPSKLNDIMKAVRGDSYFEYKTDKFTFVNRYEIRLQEQPDLDYLSETDIECLNYAIDLCRDMSFSELTQFSHGLAWTKGCMRDNISFSDMLVEVHDEAGYIDYISAKRKLNEAVSRL